jgi:type IV pilus assembly protein PilC
VSANGHGISAGEFLRFNEHLLGLVEARMPLDEGLRRMVTETRSGRLKAFVGEIAEDVEQGSQLSEALAKRKPFVADYYVALVRAGERAGSLAEVLHHIITETRRQIDHRRAVVISLAYPIMVFCLAMAVLMFLCWKVIPEFVDVYHDLGADLPVPTQITVNVAFALRDHLLIVGAALAGFIGAVLVIPPVRPVRDALLLNLPIVGRLVFADMAISFSRCLGFLLARGVPMTEALGLTESVMQNVVARRYVGEVREGVAQGESLGDMLDVHVFLPPSTRWMIHLAEERGDLDRVLLDIASAYEFTQEQVRRTVRGMLEPAMIVALGLLIGWLVITLYLPLFAIPHIIR